MNLIDTTPEFQHGHGGATAAAAPVANSTRIIKGVRIKSLVANSDLIYVGGPGVTVLTGFELSPGEEVLVKVDDPSKVSTIATPSQNQKQTVSISGSVTDDTFKLTIAGETTGTIDEDADAAAVEAALEGLASVGASDVTVTGGPGPGTDWVVEWAGVYAGINRPLLVASEAGQNEVQTVGIDNATTSGSFTLTYAGEETGTINWNADAAAVKAALDLLPNIDLVAVTGGPGPGTDWIVEFQGTLARTDVALMTGDGTLLVGGTTTVSVAETAAGNSDPVVVVTQTQDAALESQFSWLAN